MLLFAPLYRSVAVTMVKRSITGVKAKEEKSEFFALATIDKSGAMTTKTNFFLTIVQAIHRTPLFNRVVVSRFIIAH